MERERQILDQLASFLRDLPEERRGVFLTRLQELLAPRDGGCEPSNFYILRDKVGEGGMGVVYRATDARLKRDVAVKIVNRNEEELLDRFLREREITAELDHPSFIRVLAAGYVTTEEGSLPFYSMPLIRGTTLDVLLQQPHPEYTFTRLLLIVQQVCLALQSAHDKRIVHRDIKPSNILIGPYGEVYVMDLGLAKRLDDPQLGETRHFEAHVRGKIENRTITHDTALGTPYYMAPEQILSPRRIDHRADIFGIGGLLYFVLTGRKPQYVEPVIDRERVRDRMQEIATHLERFTGPSGSVTVLLWTPPGDLGTEVRPLVEEYNSLEELMSLSEYARYRLVMQECDIIPPRQIVDQIRASADVASGRVVPPDPVDPAIEEICMRALAKKRDDRYESCRALWRELQAFIEGRRRTVFAQERPPATVEECESGLQILEDEIRAKESRGRTDVLDDLARAARMLLEQARMHVHRAEIPKALAAYDRAQKLLRGPKAELDRLHLVASRSGGLDRILDADLDRARVTLQEIQAAVRDHPLLAGVCEDLGAVCHAIYRLDRKESAYADGRRAFEEGMRTADASGASRIRVACRVGLADLLVERGAEDALVERLLHEAEELASGQPELSARVHQVWARWLIRKEKWEHARRRAEEGYARALESGCDLPLCEQTLLLGMIAHHLGNPDRRRKYLKLARGYVGPRIPTMEEEVRAFYAKHDLDIAELDR